MIKIYGASLISHARMWTDWGNKNRDIITLQSRWQANVLAGATEEPANARVFWWDDESDVLDSDVLVVYAADGDTLRGALVEAGMAIAYDKPVYITGDSRSYGTWQYHPSVRRVKDLDTLAAEFRSSTAW